MNIPEESPEIFKDYIQLDTPMTVQQATETLAAFHKTTNEAVSRVCESKRSQARRSSYIQKRKK